MQTPRMAFICMSFKLHLFVVWLAPNTASAEAGTSSLLYINKFLTYVLNVSLRLFGENYYYRFNHRILNFLGDSGPMQIP